MQKYVNELLWIIDHMEPHHWVLVLGGVIVVGLVCLKSMSAKSHY